MLSAQLRRAARKASLLGFSLTHKQVETSMATQPQQDTKDAEHRGGHMTEEADIGSGGKTPAEQETDEEMKKIKPHPPSSAAASARAPR